MFSVKATLTLNKGGDSEPTVIQFDSNATDLETLGDAIKHVTQVKDEIVRRMDAIALQERQEQMDASPNTEQTMKELAKSMDDEDAEMAGVDIDDADIDDSVVRVNSSDDGSNRRKKQKTMDDA